MKQESDLLSPRQSTTRQGKGKKGRNTMTTKGQDVRKEDKKRRAAHKGLNASLYSYFSDHVTSSKALELPRSNTSRAKTSRSKELN